jgi:hypothetical protein
MATTFKVATLIVKTLVKPLANHLKKNAVHEGWFRNTCHWAGQVSNTILTHVQLRSMGHKVKKIKPMPTDDAVKAGADLVAEAAVLSTGMLAIGAEVIRKAKSDQAAAEKKELEIIEEKQRKEKRVLEKEKALKEQLLRLETRMMEVENSKFASLHEKLLHEQQKHLTVTENLLKRIHYLENELKIVTPYPLLPSHRPPSLPSNIKYDKNLDKGVVQSGNDTQNGDQQTNKTPTPAQSAAAVLEQHDAQPQPPSLYQKMRDQTNKLFAYSTFFQTTPPATATATTPTPSTPATQQSDSKLSELNGHHEAETEHLHYLLDTSLPEICTVTSADVCADAVFGLAHSIALEDMEDDNLSAVQNLIQNDIKEIKHDVEEIQNEISVNDAKLEHTQNEKKMLEKFDQLEQFEPIHNGPKLIDKLPTPKPVPLGKQHLSVKLGP